MECYFHKLKKEKKASPDFYLTCSHISLALARSFPLCQMQEVFLEGRPIFEKPRLVMLATWSLKSGKEISLSTVLKHLSRKQHLRRLLLCVQDACRLTFLFFLAPCLGFGWQFWEEKCAWSAIWCHEQLFSSYSRSNVELYL